MYNDNTQLHITTSDLSSILRMISNVLHNISIWISTNHPKFNMAGTKLLVFPNPVLPLVFYTFVNGKTIFNSSR